MNLLLDITIKVTAVVLLAFAAAWLLRGRSAAIRHWILAAAIASAAAIPLLGLVVPAWRVPLWSLLVVERATSDGVDVRRLDADDVPARSNAGTAVESAVVATSDGATPSASIGNAAGVLFWIWMTGISACAGVLLVGFGRLAWLASRSMPVREGMWSAAAADIAQRHGLRRPPLLLQSDHPSLLVTWGLLQPKIILPSSAPTWTEDRIRVVLAHELAHIRRRDWLVQMAAEFLRSIYWFNPVLWIGCARLRQESEQACDDAVLDLGIDGAAYAKHLLDLARAFRAHSGLWLPAPAIARPSSLERRVAAMLNTQVDRQPVTPFAAGAVLLVFLGITASIAGFEAFAQARFATVSGAVVDQGGGVLVNATLVLASVQTNAKNEVRTNQTGFYEFVGLPAGDYELEVRQPAFKPVKEPLSLGVGESAQRNFTLQVGSVQETITVTGESGEPARSSTRARTGLPARPRCPNPAVGGCVVPPVKVKDVRPAYPPALSESGVEGTVLLEAQIGADGKTRVVRVISSPHPAFDRAAIDAVSGWEFLPTTLNGSEIDTQMNISVTFTRPAASAPAQ